MIKIQSLDLPVGRAAPGEPGAPPLAPGKGPVGRNLVRRRFGAPGFPGTGPELYRGQPIRKQHRYHPEWSHRRNPVRLSRRRLHPDRLAAGRAAHRLPASPAGGPVLRRRRSRRRDRLRWRNTGAIALFSLTFYGDGGNIDPILPALVEDRYILQQKGRLIMSYIPMAFWPC